MAASVLRVAKGFSNEFQLLERSRHSAIFYGVTTRIGCSPGSRRRLHLPNPLVKRGFRSLDDVPSNYDLVYKSSLNNYIVYLYALSVTPAVASVGVLAYSALRKRDPVHMLKQTFFDSEWQIFAAMPIVLTIAGFVWMIANRCVLRVYMDEDNRQFVAILGTLNPWRVRKLTFDAGQIKCLTDNSLEDTSAWRAFRGEYKLDAQRLIIFPHNFKLAYHYNVMMGYAN